VPGLSSVHPVEGSTIDMSWLPWALVCALALSVLAIGWLLFERAPQPLPAPVAPTAESTPQAAAQLPTPAPAPASPQPVETIAEPARLADTAAVAEPLPDLDPTPELREPAPVDASVAELYRQQEEAPEPAPDPQRPALRQPATAGSVAPAREEEAIDIDQLVQEARGELADAQLSDSDVPFLSAQSQQTKDAIPTIMYLRHDYSGNPASASVVLNGKTLRQGGSVNGVRVEEILPDSVVLEYQGTRFRLRALNSWVNL
jgi:hypothetical protein